MKCLTLCQPYAHLVVTPQVELPRGQVQKRVENRIWSTAYRGPLLIHAGKSLKWMRDGDGELFPTMTFGALVGRCIVVDIVNLAQHRKRTLFREDGLHQWLLSDVHASGPFCWILENAERFAVPIEMIGKMGLFEVDEQILTVKASETE